MVFPGSATLQRGFWSRAGARRSQGKTLVQDLRNGHLVGRHTSDSGAAPRRVGVGVPPRRPDSPGLPEPACDVRLPAWQSILLLVHWLYGHDGSPPSPATLS